MLQGRVNLDEQVEYTLGVFLVSGKYGLNVFQIQIAYGLSVFLFYGFRVNPTGHDHYLFYYY